MNILAKGFLPHDNDLTKGCFRKTVVGHINEGEAGDIETAERTEEPSLLTIFHPSSHHLITLPYPYLVLSPPVTPLLSPYSSAPCGLHVFSLQPQSIISASPGQYSPFPHPVILPSQVRP